MSRWERFYRNIQLDLRLYLFILGLLCLYRVGFIAVMNSHLSEAATVRDIGTALFYGLRISMKSTVVIIAVPFICCSCVSLFASVPKLGQIRLGLGYFFTGVLTLLFFARIPYYEQFHMAFNQFLFNTFRDDVYALFLTLIQQYDLVPRLLAAAVVTMLFGWGLKKGLLAKTYPPPRYNRRLFRWAFRTVSICILGLFIVFSRYSGSLTYAYDVSWENSGVTKDDLLNEAILDDVQALYRAYVMHERLQASNGITVDDGKMHEYGAFLAGRDIKADLVDDYLKKTAKGAKIPKPRHVFLIIGESYANWPLLPGYKDLNIANGLKSIIAKEDAAYVPTFLPNGLGTIAGVNGIVTGFTEVNLYLNYQPETYKEPYATGLAAQMKRLGYRTYFWYAGPDSWERIKDFTLAQGFDEFHAYGDFESKAGNVWGSDDKYLFNAVEESLDNDQPTFHVILTVSNHAPYTVKLEEEGFDPDNVIGGLPEKNRSDKDMLTKLGHFWYADKMLARFADDMRRSYPDSLFVITGDHADRFNIENSPGLYQRYAVPFVIYGRGVSKTIFPNNAAGSHIDITPTIIELIAPQGFEYYSVGNSLTNGNSMGYNYGFWITNGFIGKIDDAESVQTIGNPSDNLIMPDKAAIERSVAAGRAVSWWRIQNGKYLR